MEGVQRRLSRRGSSASSLHSLGAPTDFVDMVPLNGMLLSVSRMSIASNADRPFV